MFTGIIESLGTVEEINSAGSNKTFWISSPISHTFKIDQSVSHNGVCLTVEEISGDRHRVTAIDETLSVTELGSWKKDSLINLEQCLRFNGRIDGHIVQGHVDSTVTCTNVLDKNGSWEYSFSFDPGHAPLVIEKGSVCLGGISLTAFHVTRNSFTVGIIPYTLEHTNIRNIRPGDKMNIEFDLLGKYIRRSQELNTLAG